MKKAAAILLALLVFVSFSSFGYANHIKMPIVPVEGIDNILISRESKQQSCGTSIDEMLAATGEIELWFTTTWKGSSHPFIIYRLYGVNEEIKFEAWVDRNSDGHPDEYFDTVEDTERFVEEYPNPCDAVVK